MANPEHLAKLKEGVEAWNQWREENPDEEPDLRVADLKRAYLLGANLARAELSGANLAGAYLKAAKLYAASLEGADLERADLERADLESAFLQGADLRGAYLLATNFYAASLRETNFKRSIMAGTHFSDVDLSIANGLADVRHIGPSAIGIDTLYKSKGKIPEVFLRGCGVPESFITYIPSLTARPVQFYSCFISYSHADKSFARRLHDNLQGKGIRCWLDEHQLLPGDDLHDQIDRGIRMWDKVILCCSEASLTSWWVDKELDIALQKEERLWKEHGKKTLALIPLSLDGYVFDGWESGKKSMVESRKICDFTGWEQDNKKYEAQFERVVKALHTGDTGREVPPAPKL